jgi:hypothetical protein
VLHEDVSHTGIGTLPGGCMDVGFSV